MLTYRVLSFEVKAQMGLADLPPGRLPQRSLLVAPIRGEQTQMFGVKRREFMTLLGAATAWPLAARAHGPNLGRDHEVVAQQPTMPRVGYIWIGARGTEVSNAGLRQGLADRGYIVGRDLVFEERYAEGNAERVPALIAELLELNVDVLVTPGTLITRAAQRATEMVAAQGATRTVPIVCVTGNPYVGLAPNVTGLAPLPADYSAKWLELLALAVPRLRRVAVLWNPDNPGAALQPKNMQKTARTLKHDLTILSARPEEIEASFAAITTSSFEGLVVTDDPFLELHINRIVVLAAERRLPALYAFSSSVQQGGLMSYSANIFALWRRAAGYVDQILKHVHPADLPVEHVTEVALNINLKTAKALGLTIPPTLLARANEVIE